ncbi:MAG: hypothetical protein RJA63_3217 [Pseudomonadota bacterium]|jgi:hypothetical protein
MLDQRYAKTEAGRAEIKARALGLSRTARNLLLVIDAGKTARDWLALVQGAEEEHLRSLIEPGLIAATAAAAAPAAAPQQVSQAEQLKQAYGETPRLNYEELSSLLSSQAPKQLGTIRGYGWALDVEKCATLAELQALGLQFVERVAQSKGEDAARQMRLLLGLR